MRTSFGKVIVGRVGQVLIGLAFASVAIAIGNFGDGRLGTGRAVVVGIIGAIGILIGFMGFFGTISDLLRDFRGDRKDGA